MLIFTIINIYQQSVARQVPACFPMVSAAVFLLFFSYLLRLVIAVVVSFAIGWVWSISVPFPTAAIPSPFVSGLLPRCPLVVTVLDWVLFLFVCFFFIPLDSSIYTFLFPLVATF